MIERICLVLCRWTVALAVFGLATAPLHASAGASGPQPDGVMLQDQGVQPGHAGMDCDHHDAQARASGKGCCHPGCVAAVIPALVAVTRAPASPKLLAVAPARLRLANIPSGIDHPPKAA